MSIARLLILVLSVVPSCAPQSGGVWPQASGPHANWSVPEVHAPTSWSVARDEHILWRCPLPNAGQGGLALSRDKLFVETFPEQAREGVRQSNRVLGHCIDRATGALLWSVELQGGRPSPQMYAFSDSTSWSPVCDETRVWFFNSSGVMACYDHAGNPIWERVIRSQPDAFPFNRQCEPILAGELILTIEPIAITHKRFEPERAHWNYLHAVDRSTGSLVWIAKDPCTFYCTPVLGPHGVLVGRGGPHDVPEKPIGLSMIDVATGKSVWSFEPSAGDGWEALYAMHADAQHAYWFKNAPEESHLVLVATTGALLREQSLVRDARVTSWDASKAQYSTRDHVEIRTLADHAFPLQQGEVLHVHPQWHTNIVANGYHWFLCTTNNRRNALARAGHSGPAFSLGRVHIATGKVEYLELPVGVAVDGARKYGAPLRTKTLDARGVEIADEDRSRTDGWEIDAFFPTPVVIGKHLYLTTTLGTVAVVDTTASVLDARALTAVNDLGELGDCWSMSTPSAAEDGVLYHRTAREVVAIGEGSSSTAAGRVRR